VTDSAPANPDAHDAAPSWRRAWITLLLVTVFGLAIDLASKSIAFANVADAPAHVSRADVLALPPDHIGALIPQHEPVTFIPYVLEFQLVLNPGAVFGVGAGKRIFFVAFTGIAVAVALWMFRAWTKPRDLVAHTAVGLVLAGGLGNLYDRLQFACVRDFLHPLPGVNLPFGVTWPGGETEVWPWVSNIADALLLIGIAVLMIKLWRAEPPPPERAVEAKPE
jgi:signal peptidase II